MNERLINMVIPVLVMAFGMFAAWKCPDRLGWKSLAVYYLARTAFIFIYIPSTGWIPYDIRTWMVHADWMAADGLFPDVDFLTAYHLGFNLLLYVAYRIFPSPYSIMAAFTVFELIAVPVLYHALKTVFDDRVARCSVILFVTSPACWDCAVYGQDEPIILAAVAGVLLLLARSRLLSAAFVAFLGFAGTKMLTPMYFGLLFLVKRWKGVLVLLLAVIAYILIPVAIGIDPFDFRSADSLTEVARDISADGYARGTVWYYLQPVPSWLQFGSLLAVFSLIALAFVKGLWLDAAEHLLRLRLVCVLTALFGFSFCAFYRICHEPYMMPFLPLIIAALMGAKIRKRVRSALTAAFVVWAYVFVHKDPHGPSVFMSLGYALDVAVYLGYLVFPAALLYGYRKNLTSPVEGLKSLPGVLGR